MPLAALTSAEISLPGTPDALRVRDRIAALADTVDLVGLTDNHAGQPRMSPLAAVALAREQGVATVVHVSCRDRNRMALQSQVLGAAALGSEGVLCLYGDAVEGVPRVKDLTATSLIAKAKEWAQPHELAVGAVVNPFAPDLQRELRLLEKKLTACLLPDSADRRIRAGGGVDLAVELAAELAAVPGVDALHVYPLGAEVETRDVAAAFRSARGASERRQEPIT